MNLKGRTILVTGAAGFIGRALCLRALGAGIRVRGVDLRDPAIEHADFEFVQGEMGNTDLYARLLRGIDLVINCAALVAEGGPFEEFRSVNVDEPVRLARAARRAGVRGFFQFSSVMVYGFRYPAMVRETGPYGGEHNPYCQTKTESELALLNLHRPGAFEVFVVRPGDVYGPGSVPWVVRPLRMMKQRTFALVDRGQGTMNHVYIDNLLDAVFLMIEKNASDRAYNVTDGARTTFEEYFSRLAAAGGRKRPRSLPGWLARFLGHAANALRGLGLSLEFSREAVDFVLRPHPVSIDSAIHLGYEPRISLDEGMMRVQAWLETADLKRNTPLFVRPKAKQTLLLFACILLAWLFFPGDYKPHAAQAEPLLPLSGVFAANQALAGASEIALVGFSDPEHVVVHNGGLYASTLQGAIVRLDRGRPEVIVDTGGRPLGFVFDARGQLWIADSHKGLMVFQAGVLRPVVQEYEGKPFAFTNSVAAAKNGRIYFTDASHFGAREHGTLNASVLDLLEASCTGRLFEYDPALRRTALIRDGLCFANGLALDSREESVFLAETGRSRITRVFIAGTARGASAVLIDSLPGYPDNLLKGRGKYWVGLVKPRSAISDTLSEYPGLRRAVMRLPSFLWPVPKPYGHLISFDESGKVLRSLQDPEGRVGEVTGAFETPEALYISRLHGSFVGRLLQK